MGTTVAVRTCRILYFGPAGGGKSANLARIRDAIPVDFVMPTSGGADSESVAFRFAADGLGEWVVELAAGEGEAGEVPRPRQALSFDGVVFVANSDAMQLDANLASLEALKDYLESCNADLTSLPLVLQYNKRDLPGVLPLTQLESLLNPWGMPSFEAIASRGVGVRETLQAIVGLTIRQVTRAQSEQPSLQADGGPGAARPDPGQTEAPVAAATEAESSAPRSTAAVARGEPAGAAPSIQIETDAHSGSIFGERRPPVVIPVRVPRAILEKYGSVSILLELEVDPNGPGVG